MSLATNYDYSGEKKRKKRFSNTSAFQNLSRESQIAVLDSEQHSAHEKLGIKHGVKLTPLPVKRLF